MQWLQVEKARHVLLLREKLTEQHRTQDLSKLDKDALNKYRRQGHVTSLLSDKERQRSSTDVEKSSDDLHSDLENVIDTSTDPSTSLIVKCLKLMLNNRTAKRARLLSAVCISFVLSLCHYKTDWLIDWLIIYERSVFVVSLTVSCR